MPYIIKGQCIYKKSDGSKVGCTKGNVKKYLAALHANVDESEAQRLAMEETITENHEPIRKLIREAISDFIKSDEQININHGFKKLLDWDEKEYTYTDRVKDKLTNIITEVEGISEKSFELYDEAMDRAKKIVNEPAIQEIIKRFEKRDARPEYCAENIYYDKFKASKKS